MVPAICSAHLESVVGDPGWQLSSRPAAPSVVPPSRTKEEIGREARKFMGLNKDTDSGVEKQR